MAKHGKRIMASCPCTQGLYPLQPGAMSTSAPMLYYALPTIGGGTALAAYPGGLPAGHQAAFTGAGLYAAAALPQQQQQQVGAWGLHPSISVFEVGEHITRVFWPTSNSW
jgi:hypothetical protein